MKKIILKNGLTIILNKDASVHSTFVNLIIKYGYFTTKVKVKDKVYSLKPGIAHYIEHYLIEHSKYGNLLNVLGEKKLSANGTTSSDQTEYYFSGIENIKYGINILLNSVNNINLDNEDIEKTKNAILEEIRIAKDNNKKILFNASYQSLFKNSGFSSSLGDYDDIRSIKESDITTAYNSFYTLDNEILVISGNFNEKSIINYINKTTSKFTNIKSKAKKYYEKESDCVNFKTKTIKSTIAIPKISINFKIKYDYKSIDKYKLDFYLWSFVRNTFGSLSDLNEELFNNNLIDSYLIYDYLINNDYIILSIIANANDDKIVAKKIIDKIKSKDYDEEAFDLDTKGSIISLIARSERHVDYAMSYVHNLIQFDYDYIDNIDFIKTLSFEEYKSFINNIDFSNYSIVKIIDDNKKNTD